jgi:hypothetical protein
VIYLRLILPLDGTAASCDLASTKRAFLPCFVKSTCQIAQFRLLNPSFTTNADAGLASLAAVTAFLQDFLQSGRLFARTGTHY